MINAKNENGKFSIPITLIGENDITITKDFYLDTGFEGYLKIDKKLFDELDLKKNGEKNISFANSSEEQADISTSKFRVDELKGETEILAVGWGGRNLIGTRFLKAANLLIVIDNSNGIVITTDRKFASAIGKTAHCFLLHSHDIAKINEPCPICGARDK